MVTRPARELWERFAALLVAAMGVAFARSAVRDVLELRAARRCVRRPAAQMPSVPPAGPSPSDLPARRPSRPAGTAAA
ncbi:hypothetical protein [Streptomyces sp. S.PB5]|uniref:hypothetical protein n=1 Tax=Streptomyces sp. S.PB5 TaxID=3020844 RepID=UPI0025B21979|nr:hypothetical protein [Streptomyces sp. S.PB5]MDN3029203.1 hypothetical protein [Streptomyces sp. S.PB5]